MFTLVGDSNVRRGLSPANVRGRPQHSSAQFISCGRLSTFAAALEETRQESDACIVSCVTNFVTGSVSSSSSVSSRVETIMTGFFEKLSSFATSRPALQIFVCAPMYRTTPLWYREGISEILVKFSSLAPDPTLRPGNLFMMPSFPNPQLEMDGVHLNPYSGMEFILFLFDAAEELVSKARSTTEVQLSHVVDSNIAFGHRFVALERDHARLSKRFEHEVAVRAEFDDYQTNLANEVFFMIQGLARLPKLDPKVWQTRAVADVNAVLALLGFDPLTEYVQNSTGHGADSRTLYKVRVGTIELSRSIRNKFASFFRGGKDTRPPSLAQISIRNCVTTATLGGVAILQLLGRRYRDSNPGSKFQCIAYESRPVLKLTPPPGASDRRVQSYNFIEAVTKLPTTFTPDEIEGLLRRISPHLHGSMREIFIVVSPDMLPRNSKNSKKKSTGAANVSTGSESSPASGGTPEGSQATGSRRRKRPAATPVAPSAKK